MVWGWFWDGLGVFSDRLRKKIKIENLKLKKYPPGAWGGLHTGSTAQNPKVGASPELKIHQKSIKNPLKINKRSIKNQSKDQ